MSTWNETETETTDAHFVVESLNVESIRLQLLYQFQSHEPEFI